VKLPRIYADFNGLVNGPKTLGSTAVVLDTFGSLRDLANAGIVLSQGMQLSAFDISDETEDLEGHGTAEFDYENNWWVIEFDHLGVRYVVACERSQSTEFRCVACQADLLEKIEKQGLNLGDTCPTCNKPIHAPIAPPDRPAS
jgi:DNA-directed RNA polymerase subunit RPC12/RpoP